MTRWFRLLFPSLDSSSLQYFDIQIRTILTRLGDSGSIWIKDDVAGGLEEDVGEGVALFEL
jgi:hypothetical protein